jgi:cytosine/uracil/thiamine/allantoin permease
MAWGVPALRIYGWFVGFGVAFIVHLVLMKVVAPKQQLAPEAV